MGKWTYFSQAGWIEGPGLSVLVGDKDWNDWFLVDPDGEVHNEYRYRNEADVACAAEILNRHVPGQEYITVCFTVKVDPSTRRQLSILEDGEVEMDADSLRLLYEQAFCGNAVFGIAEVGCPDWAERAGADPSLWED